jgi:hypothetical protein
MRVLLLFILVSFFVAETVSSHDEGEISDWSSSNVQFQTTVLITNTGATSSTAGTIDTEKVKHDLTMRLETDHLPTESLEVFGGRRIRNLRGEQEDRELCGCPCLCAARSYLCIAYCGGWRRRVLEVAPVDDGEGQDERRQLLIVETASKMKSELIEQCYESLGDMVTSALASGDEALSKTLKGAKCSATVSII